MAIFNEEKGCFCISEEVWKRWCSSPYQLCTLVEKKKKNQPWRGDWLCLGFVSSVQFSRSVVSDSLRPRESQHTRPPCPSPTPGVYSNSRPSSRWCRLFFCQLCFKLTLTLPKSISFFRPGLTHYKMKVYWLLQCGWVNDCLLPT